MNVRSNRYVSLWVGLVGGLALQGVAGVASAQGRSGKASFTQVVDGGEDKVDVELWANFTYPPTEAEFAAVKEAFHDAALIHCDATDTQLRIRKVHFTLGNQGNDGADVVLLPRSLETSGSQSGRAQGRLWLYGYSAGTLAHELGHYLYGLPDAYERQRFSGGCGTGPSIDDDIRDEFSNTIMWGKGRQCHASGTGEEFRDFNPLDWEGFRCESDADCACTAAECPAGVTFTCPQVPARSSELTTQATHDPLSGTGNDCPGPRPARFLVVNARARASSGTFSFDPSSFDTAVSTSNARHTIAVIDELGRLEGSWTRYSGQSNHRVTLYWVHVGTDQWALHLLGRGEEFEGGTPGAHTRLPASTSSSMGLTWNSSMASQRPIRS